MTLTVADKGYRAICEHDGRRASCLVFFHEPSGPVDELPAVANADLGTPQHGLKSFDTHAGHQAGRVVAVVAMPSRSCDRGGNEPMIG